MLLYYKTKPIHLSHFQATAVIFIFCILSCGCKKFVDVNPPASSITASVVYSNNSSASAVMTGVYSNMIATSSGLTDGSSSISILEGLASDELKSYYNLARYNQFYQNSLLSNTAGVSNNYFWKEIYQEIHVVNTLIEGLQSSTAVASAIKQQLDGEAKFIRAFYNFYAVNIYGDVPLVTGTNYQVNNVLKRTPAAQVYQQIINDLKEAQTELSPGFVDGLGNVSTERGRPNKGAAAALLSRVYLYTGDWADAKSEADSVINNTANYTLLSDLTQVFKKNSKEAIWQLSPVVSGYNTFDAQFLVLTAPPGTVTFPFSLSSNLINAFEANDLRLSKWVGVYQQNSTTSFYYPYKYTANKYGSPVIEYFMVLRLAEQYLIRAEAKAQLGDISGSQSDLNAIRTRAGLHATTAVDKASLLTAILHERQVELFTEWGHRWFDLIRTGTVNSILGSPGNVCQSKGGTWSPNWVLAPLPLGELQANSNLTQNPGYN